MNEDLAPGIAEIYCSVNTVTIIGNVPFSAGSALDASQPVVATDADGDDVYYSIAENSLNSDLFGVRTESTGGIIYLFNDTRLPDLDVRDPPLKSNVL